MKENHRKIRVVTATALFDGHDVSVNIFRRVLQKRGLEVIHLGHNRPVDEVVASAIEENVDAILVSSYQGGHNEYFRYVIDLLKEYQSEHILVFGGGGGVILPSEIKALQEYGVARLYHAEDGKLMGIDGITDDIIERIEKNIKRLELEGKYQESDIADLNTGDKRMIGRLISVLENYSPGDVEAQKMSDKLAKQDKGRSVVLGITGTGGSGKSSITDELVNRLLKVSSNITIGILAADPSKSTTGGALLGDRIRMNSIYNDRVYMRSFATRQSATEISEACTGAIRVLKGAGFDVIIVETSGIGQRDHSITEISDKSIYVMTAEYGAPSQLDKIDMLDRADFIVVNKCCKPGSEDAVREVTLRHIKNHNIPVSLAEIGSILDLELPIYATEANQFNNPGINQLFKDILAAFNHKKQDYQIDQDVLNLLTTQGHKDFTQLRGLSSHYLEDIAYIVENYHRKAAKEIETADKCYALKKSLETVKENGDQAGAAAVLEKLLNEHQAKLDPASITFLEDWPAIKQQYNQPEIVYQVRDKDIKVKTSVQSLSGSHIPRVALPSYTSWGELLRFCYKENLPGYFPFTASVFPFQRTQEDPKRQFAGEGSPEKTNKRFHYLSRNDPSKRLSTAFDPITLYGENPSTNPDVYGKIGESGVSICTLDDMKKLYAGFDLSDPMTSVSMTINGPAPIVLAMFFMTAYDQAVEKKGSDLTSKEKIALFRKLRGTVQADILKEDQGQNACIFSIDFALRMMGDVQSYFSKNKIGNYYTISISGYHIAEAGANPITQLALTLANGFHYVEFFSSLGLSVDEFAPNLSFFFSNGMEPEYSVIGRVARRIWAIAMRDRYGADENSQRLKYHIQTSGRSLHAQEIDFNDIRTTLQAVFAFYDNCNSLHTNSYDEAVTTPTEESVRRSMAVQLILNKEFGMLKNENPNQGAFIIEELTDLVEKAVLEEFRRISYRGGVLGAMEKQYQRNKIQEESLYYEELKHNGTYPIIGVNTFINENPDVTRYDQMEVRRATPQEKRQQLENLKSFEEKNRDKAPRALQSLKKVILSGENIFEELLTAVRYASLGQITHLLYEIGGKYRRNM
ncbi:MAG: methylmalonyl-CoA mutase [Phycisphaerae bacterium SM23_30]|nr:MAG: methylmalonyl-CoA mutase [Phycisphaerae bacterium SM23_30]